ncbi:MAG: YggS family pyridoxal phosphate-dependent enzyme [Planctomycetales bacterium]|nr:YggS family pyridoxal phosphate-dependent enzyme [bacterium]UNM07839.1 MAG: YggS family pyridoxal phosphate-dependent enzyme [Planctomycetales bacterium]
MKDASRIAANLQAVREDIDRFASGGKVRLVCVTKYAELHHVRLLLDAGADELGENLLPTAAERFKQLTSGGYCFIRHLIGPQQSRKVGMMPGNFDMFQALDRMKVALKLQQELLDAGSSMEVLLQVNISAEEQKSGFAIDETASAISRIREECPSLLIRGLMSIPAGPQSFATEAEFERETARSFGQMRALFDRISASLPAAMPFDVLSQGMSHDYRLALVEGSNMIRIGSALFAGLEGK